MSNPPSDAARMSWSVPLILAMIAVGSLGLFLVARNRSHDPNARQSADNPLSGKKLSRDDSLKLMVLRNKALGDLENHEFDSADAALVEILKILPGDPFGSRNLAICRQLALESTEKHKDPEAYDKKVDRAVEAADESKAKEPNSFIPRLISARVATKLDQPEIALAELRDAIRLGPDEVGPAYDLFMLIQSLPGEKYQDEGFQALKKAYVKEHNNLFLIKDLLPELAQHRSPEFPNVLKEVKSTISPFVELIKVHTRVDLIQLTDTAIKDATEGNWQKAQRSMTTFKNLLLAESARDKRYVMLDSLEYVVFDFAKESLTRFDLPERDEGEASKPVHFVVPSDLSKLPTLGQGDRFDLAVADFDLDGKPDFAALNGNQLAAWGQKSTDGSWSVLANVSIEGDFIGVLAYDLDDDIDTNVQGGAKSGKGPEAAKSTASINKACQSADPDLVLFGPAGIRVLENRLETDTNARSLNVRSGGAEIDAVRDVVTVVVTDVDADGDLDIVAVTSGGPRIFASEGSWAFHETTRRSQLPPDGRQIIAIAAVDWDKDTDVDLLLSFADGAGLLENVRHGQFRYRDLKEFIDLKQASHFCIADFDANGSWDVVATGAFGSKLILTDSTPAGVVSPRKQIALATGPAKSAQSGDFDNDGQLDVLLVSDHGATIVTASGSNQFKAATAETNDSLKDASFAAIEDLDRDGDLDLVVRQGDKVLTLISQCREVDNPDNDFIELQLVADLVRPGEQNSEKRTNHVNVGGTIEVKSGAGYQQRMVAGAMTHFGLGRKQRPDVARVVWTNGIPSDLVNPTPHEIVCITQKLGGSCPYLYAWNGERFDFVTDLLWNAPLGLKFAESVIAPWREWEYLKIEGRQLKPVDNEYQLRITAELWEAEYFDECKLIAIDHPVGTEIYTNEKVGPPDIAQHKIHTVRSPRSPVSARDGHDRDQLNHILKRDGDYTKTFEKRHVQGLTEEHYLELDLGDLKAEKQITLFLTGWMYPGSTSLRIRTAQDPNLPPLKPPSLWAVDTLGQWREVQPLMGFPGGKTKTIAVDLSNVFAGNDHRLRIVSTIEIYWDQAFFTVDDEPVEIRQTELPLAKARLVDRGGVSFHSWPASGHGPDQFDYSRLVPGEQWPAMSGNFTRFGDVLPLLTKRDDHLVVIGSGDEIQLSFAESNEAIPAGWVRDFVIYTVGWDKDADQNTVYGDMVEPLPFEGMTDYAHRNGESRPLDEAYLNYLKTYQTRSRNPTRYWKNIKDYAGVHQ